MLLLLGLLVPSYWPAGHNKLLKWNCPNFCHEVTSGLYPSGRQVSSARALGRQLCVRIWAPVHMLCSRLLVWMPFPPTALEYKDMENAFSSQYSTMMDRVSELKCHPSSIISFFLSQHKAGTKKMRRLEKTNAWPTDWWFQVFNPPHHQ